MKKNKKYLLILTLSLLLLGPVFGSLPASAQTRTKPNTIVFFPDSDPAIVIPKLENGEIDIFAGPITDRGLLAQIEASPELDYYQSYGLYYELTFNPAGPVFNNGKLNPFAVPRVREAMNYLIDRDYLAQNVLSNLPTPRWTALNSVSLDAALLGGEVRALELNYAYNKNLAKQIIDGEMLALGAILNAGKWYYGGEPVEISVLIRIEDVTRIEIGDFVADQLEDIGFQVIRDKKPSAEAGYWYSGDPAEGLFHIYISGWGTSMIPRDLADNFAFFYTKMGIIDSPLWQAYVNTPEFYALAQRLDSGDYSTFEERYTMMARALELSLEDSVRIFLIDAISFIPKSIDVSLASDLYGGVAGSWLWAKSIQSSRAQDSQVTIAIPSQPGSWNPIAGGTWGYERMPIRGTADFGTVPDPYTGLYLPDRIERAEVVVQEGLFVQKTTDWVDLDFAPEIVVPQDAWADWDAEAQVFKTVGELGLGPVTAQRKSTVYYPEDLFETVTWHDGSPFSIADILMHLILTFDRAQEKSPIYDESAVWAYERFMSDFKGLKIISEEPLIIETYSDAVAIDAENNVTTWWPYYATGPGAWHALALGISAEAAGEAAFSWDKADKYDLYHLDYVANDPIGVGIWNDFLENWLLDREIPYTPTLGAYISEDELNARLGNLSEWHVAYGHFWVGTGPYFLDSLPEWTFDGPPPTLTLQRFPDHPDSDDRWDDYTELPIPNVQVIGPDRIELGGEAVYDIFVTLPSGAPSGQSQLLDVGLRSGQPYPSKDIERVDYLLVGGNTVYVNGQAVYVDEGHYRVVVDKSTASMLPGGEIRLEVVVVTKRVALPSTSSVAIDNQNHTIFLPLTLR